MAAIIVYGSLINPEQLRQHPHLFASAYPVFVKGYRRSFNQEPSWREGEGKHSAVLSIMKSAKDGFNGLLVQLQEGSDFHQLDKRERGYDRIAISQSQLVPFTPIASVIEPEGIFSEGIFSEGICSEGTCSEGIFDPIFIYVGKSEKQNNDILPNRRYLDLCLCGAMHWGEAFQEQFLQTTYVEGLTLKAFLSR